MRLPECRHQQYGVFTATQARAAGVSRDRLRGLIGNERVLGLRRGVYVDAEHWRMLPPLGRSCARGVAAGLAIAGSAVSHHSAARIHALPMLEPIPAAPSVTVPLEDRRRGGSGPGLILRRARLPAHAVDDHGAWRVTTVPRTLCDLSRVLAERFLLVVVDAALARELTTVETLRAVADELSPNPGSGMLRWVIGRASGLAESPYESLARWWLGQLGIVAVPQVWAYDETGPIGCVARVASAELGTADRLATRVAAAAARGRIARAASPATGWIGPPPAWARRGYPIVPGRLPRHGGQVG